MSRIAQKLYRHLLFALAVIIDLTLFVVAIIAGGMIGLIAVGVMASVVSIALLLLVAVLWAIAGWFALGYSGQIADWIEKERAA